MFEKLFKKKSEPEKIIEETVTPLVCEFNDNDNCDLILKLREYQSIEKDVKKEIETLKKDSDELLFNFAGFLKSLENNGLVLDRQYGDRSFFSLYNADIVKKTINKYSSDNIHRVAEELKTYKYKDNIIVEKEKVLKEIQSKIKDIKNKLGIE